MFFHYHGIAPWNTIFGGDFILEVFSSIRFVTSTCTSLTIVFLRLAEIKYYNVQYHDFILFLYNKTPLQLSLVWQTFSYNLICFPISLHIIDFTCSSH